MTIETVPVAVTDRLRSLVAARSIADREGASMESVDFETATRSGPDAAAVSERVSTVLAPEGRQDDEVGNPAEFRQALDTMLRVTRAATGKLDADPAALLPGSRPPCWRPSSASTGRAPVCWFTTALSTRSIRLPVTGPRPWPRHGTGCATRSPRSAAWSRRTRARATSSARAGWSTPVPASL